MDALSVLRDYTARKELDNVHRVGDEYHFGDDYRFPCSTETGYRSKQGFFYTLDALVFFVKSSNLKHTEYMQQARALKLQIVTFTDKKPLLDYLQGKVSTSDAIQLLPPGGATAAAAASDKLSPGDPAAAGVEEGGEALHLHAGSKRMRSDSEQQPVDACMLIEIVRSYERPVRDRETILLCPNKSFEGILSSLGRQRIDQQQQHQQQHHQHQHQHQHQSMQQHNSSSGQQRSDKFVKVEPDKSSSDNKRPLPPPPPPSSSSQQGLSRSSSKVKIEGPPIILVPNASQTLLNTFNAKEFLEDGVYVLADAKKSAAAKKPETLAILRKIGREIPVKYEVRDKPSSLSSKDWERVVAVFVLGKDWQFKDWPFKDHVDIFNKILGVYLRFEDDSMESVKVVMQWNVKIISLSKHKRHQDRTAVLEFWDKLDAFVRARRLPIAF